MRRRSDAGELAQGGLQSDHLFEIGVVTVELRRRRCLAARFGRVLFRIVIGVARRGKRSLLGVGTSVRSVSRGASQGQEVRVRRRLPRCCSATVLELTGALPVTSSSSGLPSSSSSQSSTWALARALPPPDLPSVSSAQARSVALSSCRAVLLEGVDI